MKIWKAKIIVKFLILLLLLQISYIFITSLKVLQISTENKILALVLNFYKSGNAWVKYLTMWHRLLYISVVSKSFFWIHWLLFSVLQSLAHLANLSIWKLVGAIRISSLFSFWKLDYFSDMTCLKEWFT